MLKIQSSVLMVDIRAIVSFEKKFSMFLSKNEQEWICIISNESPKVVFACNHPSFRTPSKILVWPLICFCVLKKFIHYRIGQCPSGMWTIVCKKGGIWRIYPEEFLEDVLSNWRTNGGVFFYCVKWLSWSLSVWTLTLQKM